ncbi:hypothetical protein [Magnetospirillum molischianum]|uniref:Uncharacterized protein n=1 Tax=Magnetospirillum molischianum DSM 120 TaxID=1150626 RepID=H8FT53_MAGML|nr:hypothetical protein [Magnetospirillum molischianum]CCG41541.1 conserved hypothetical protein [Magnetospirillum molischianum DSM 120]
MVNEDDGDKRAERLKRARALAGQTGGSAPAASAPARPESARPESSASPPPLATSAPTDLTRTLRQSLLEMLTGLLRPKSPAVAQPTVPQPDPPVLTVLVAALGNDADGSGASRLNQALAARTALKVQALPKLFQLDGLEDPGLVAAVTMNTRHAVVEEDADLLLWGDLTKDGYRLRLATAASDEERFGPATRIELPLDLSEPVVNLLFAALLAATDPGSEPRRSALRRLLLPAAVAAEPMAAKPSVQMTMPQQRSVQMLFGHIAAAAAAIAPAEQAVTWADKAANAYRQAERRLGRTDAGWEGGLIHRHIAAVVAAKADRSKEPVPLLEEAIREWRSAAETLPRAVMPQEWAATQMRLGTALYRLDLMTGQTELLREALQALQATLQVYTRTETPGRWADVMHTVAQVLEVYGDQLRNTEVLQRAVDACNSVLEIRSRDRTPLAWAATQNTLGSALFLLDRHSEGGGHLVEAEMALSSALEVFHTHGAKRPAKVAARNLAHVRKLAESRKTRSVVEPHWLDDRKR